MSATNAHPPERLAELVAELAELDPAERLEVLLDYARRLPPLPRDLAAERDAGLNRVHECQTPVFLWVQVAGGSVRLYADAAEESPTVRGFVALLVDTLSGARPEEILQISPTLVTQMGLAEALGMLRSRGLHAIVHRIRTEVSRSVASSA